MCGHFLKVLQRPVLHTMKEIHIKCDVQIFSWLLILIKTSLTSFPEGPPSDMFFLIYVKVVIQRTPRPSESTWTKNFCVEMEADGENRIWATRGRDLVMFTSATQMERMLHMPSSLSVCVCVTVQSCLWLNQRPCVCFNLNLLWMERCLSPVFRLLGQN